MHHCNIRYKHRISIMVLDVFNTQFFSEYTHDLIGASDTDTVFFRLSGKLICDLHCISAACTFGHFFSTPCVYLQDEYTISLDNDLFIRVNCFYDRVSYAGIAKRRKDLRSDPGVEQKIIDKHDLLCYYVQEINLKESEVSVMNIIKNEIAVEYSVKTSVCAY